MLAYSYKKYGAPEVLESVEIPTPSPKPNEVLIRIFTTTVSAGDWRARSLTMPKGLGLMGRLVFGVTGPRKPVLGTEFSGVVETVGTEVTNYQPGDGVIGFPGVGFGAHAEFITMPADGKLTLKPENISFADAAAIPFGATTAYDFLVNKANLRAGKTSDMLFGSLKAAMKGKKMIGGVASESREVLEAVVKLAAKGNFQPLIDRKYAFADMKAAHAHVGAGHKRGNVVVSVADRAGASQAA